MNAEHEVKFRDVLFDEMAGKDGKLGIITLNRPEVLNSLNHAMVNAMHARLQVWATDSHIKAVVIRAAEGRAFCAGGDLRLTYERIKSHDIKLLEFFHDEYQLNRCIFHFPKPYIALLDGITMGGGVGISVHGSHRVATDRLLFAMPETGIGFFPDVGGTYFLPRLPGKIGFYLGLTGARLASDDCVAIGIAQHKVNREAFDDLLQALAQTPFNKDAKATVSDVINQFHVSTKPSHLLEQQSVIDDCFSPITLEEIEQKLENLENILCKEAGIVLKQKSPTSLKVTLRALLLGKELNFDDCMHQEYRLVAHFLQGHDFLEGIRALIIHKDQKPKWKPSTLQEVTEKEVEKYFAPLDRELDC